MKNIKKLFWKFFTFNTVVVFVFVFVLENKMENKMKNGNERVFEIGFEK